MAGPSQHRLEDRKELRRIRTRSVMMTTTMPDYLVMTGEG